MRDARLALGSVAPTVVRCVHAEAALRGRTLADEVVAAARQALARDIAPIDDVRSTARYRLRVAENLLIQFLKETVRGFVLAQAFSPARAASPKSCGVRPEGGRYVRCVAVLVFTEEL